MCVPSIAFNLCSDLVKDIPVQGLDASFAIEMQHAFLLLLLLFLPTFTLELSKQIF